MISLLITLVGCAQPPAPRTGADAPAADRPEPPYPRFQGNSFEPSAAAFNPVTGEVLVLNDKDSLVYRYALDAAPAGGTKLSPKGTHQLYVSDGRPLLKLESITPLDGGEFLAATTFDRPGVPAPNPWARIVRFRLDDAEARKLLLPVKAEAVAVDGALAVAVRAAAAPDEPWFKIEGIAVDAGARHAFLGVRQVGADYQHPRDVVFVVRCPLAPDRSTIGPPDAVFRFSTKQALGRDEGLSDIQRDADGSYLILTSWETPADPSAGRDDPSRHGGALFRIPAADLEGPAPAAPREFGPPLRRFTAKSEGLALLPGGRALVVFDDDNDGWKGLFRDFAPSQGMFTVVELQATSQPR